VSSWDFVVMGMYFALVLGIGAYFAKKSGDATDYFLGKDKIPWLAVMLSIVATETSALTVISIPGIGSRSNMTFLQITLGYLLGRIAVSIWLMPGYFTGEQETAYTRLENRFGARTRRLAAGVFMTVRALGDSVRVFAIAIPLSIVTNWSKFTSVAMVGVITLLYTLAGGIRAVIWVDVMQLGLYVLGGAATLVVAIQLIPNLPDAWASIVSADKLQMVDWNISFSEPYTFLTAVLGGALLSSASHGTDHLIVQRLLATKSLSGARKALVGSGILVMIQFAFFLIVGAFLWAAGADDGIMASDNIYPTFVVHQLPVGLAGLVVAGILAAAMSTMSSSLNSLASATTHDFFAPLAGEYDPKKLLRFGRIATLGWAVVLVVGALSFQADQPVVVLALSVSSITYGGLLGTYIMGGTMKDAKESDAITAILVATVFMVVVVLVKPGPFANMAWPWYVPVGTAVTLVTAWLTITLRKLRAR